MSWRDRAECKGMSPNLFYPEQGEPVRHIIAVCLECEVRDDCLREAMESGERLGIWGGLSAKQRHRLSLTGSTSLPREPGRNYGGRPRQPINHGTAAGYKTHRKRGEDACAECRAAWSTTVTLRRRTEVA